MGYAGNSSTFKSFSETRDKFLGKQFNGEFFLLSLKLNAVKLLLMFPDNSFTKRVTLSKDYEDGKENATKKERFNEQKQWLCKCVVNVGTSFRLQIESFAENMVIVSIWGL